MYIYPAALAAVTTPQGSGVHPIHAPNVSTANVPTQDPSIVDYVIEGIADLDEVSQRHMEEFYKKLLPIMKKKAKNCALFFKDKHNKIIESSSSSVLYESYSESELIQLLLRFRSNVGL